MGQLIKQEQNGSENEVCSRDEPNSKRTFAAVCDDTDIRVKQEVPGEIEICPNAGIYVDVDVSTDQTEVLKVMTALKPSNVEEVEKTTADLAMEKTNVSEGIENITAWEEQDITTAADVLREIDAE